MFVKYNYKVVNADTISHICCLGLGAGYVRVHYSKNDVGELLEGPEAFDLVMRLCPEATEGRAFKCQRRRWAIHNLFGHPLMQIFSWLGLTRLGLKIHDATVPNPKES